MLTETVNNLSDLLGIDYAILPNIITFIIVMTLISLSISGALEFKSILMIYGIIMGILTILGIDSVFNIFTLLETIIETLIDLIFMGVNYGH